MLDDKDKGEGLHRLIERKNIDNKSVYVLKTESSFPYFQEVILKRGAPELNVEEAEEERALRKAEEIFRAKIRDHLSVIDKNDLVSTKNKKEKKIEWLSKLRDAVLSLKLILVTLDSEDDAYVIFETLNTRGKDLALSDLLKNLFARHLKASGSVDHAKIKWDEVLKTLGGATVDLPADQFITHSWASRFDAVTVKQAFPKFKVSITKDTATSHLDDFLADARHYRSVFDPTYPWVKEERDIAKSFVALQMFKVVQPAPALLSLGRVVI